MATYFCDYCNNNSWSQPFENNICDDCWEKRNKKHDDIPDEQTHSKPSLNG